MGHAVKMIGRYKPYIPVGAKVPPPKIILKPKTTKGDGDCAFHSTFGTNVNGIYTCQNASTLRQEFTERVRRATPRSKLEELRNRAIRELIMSRQAVKGFEAAIASYDNFLEENEWIISTLGRNFFIELSQHQTIVKYIKDRYQEKKGQQGDLPTMFYDLLAEGNTLRALILSEPTLETSWQNYNEYSHNTYNWDAVIDDTLIQSYCQFIGADGQWLLPMEVHMIAEAFDQPIHFHQTNRGRIFYSETFKKNGTNPPVMIRFNGVNHYERGLSDHTVTPALVQHKQTKKREKPKLPKIAQSKKSMTLIQKEDKSYAQPKKAEDILKWILEKDGLADLRQLMTEKKDVDIEGQLQKFLKVQTSDEDKILKWLWNSVQIKLPASIQRKIRRISNTRSLTRKAVSAWLKWTSKDVKAKDPYLMYSNDARGKRKFMKDAIKFYFHTQFSWKVIGHPEYQTGDTTGISIALHDNPNLSVKFITGPKNSLDTNPKWVDYRYSAEKSRAMKGKYHHVYLTPMSTRQILRSSVKVGQLGTASIAKKYQGSTSFQANHVRKPWNTHVSFATKQFATCARKGRLTSVMRKRLNVVNRPEKQLIKQYFQSFGIPNNAIVLWGRTSGHNGGAHMELDSDPMIWQDLIKDLQKKFPDRRIVLVGDTVLDEPTINDLNLLSLGQFWKVDPANSNKDELESLLKRPIAQEYFRFLFKDIDATVLGMRSGILESGAALGVRSVYFDDRYSSVHDAGKRIEGITGKGASERERRMSSDKKLNEEFETKKTGPIKQYKRIVTSAEFGHASDYYKFANQFITVVDTLLNKLDQLSEINIDDDILNALDKFSKGINHFIKLKQKLQSNRNTLALLLQISRKKAKKGQAIKKGEPILKDGISELVKLHSNGLKLKETHPLRQVSEAIKIKKQLKPFLLRNSDANDEITLFELKSKLKEVKKSLQSWQKSLSGFQKEFDQVSELILYFDEMANRDQKRLEYFFKTSSDESSDSD